MLPSKIIVVYCDNHTRYMTALFCEVLSFLTLQMVVKIPLSSDGYILWTAINVGY